MKQKHYYQRSEPEDNIISMWKPDMISNCGTHNAVNNRQYNLLIFDKSIIFLFAASNSSNKEEATLKEVKETQWVYGTVTS